MIAPPGSTSVRGRSNAPAIHWTWQSTAADSWLYRRRAANVTRAMARLQINNNGELVTSEGYQVLGESGPITFQPKDRNITISQDGTISVREGNNATTESQRGQLRVVKLRPTRPVAEGWKQHLQGAGKRHATNRQNLTHRARHDREIQCAIGHGNDAHDRSDAQLHTDRQLAGATIRSATYGDRETCRCAELNVGSGRLVYASTSYRGDRDDGPGT